MFKRGIIILLSLFLVVPSAFALNRDGAISSYQSELEALGMDSGDAQKKATQDVDALINSMKSSQSDVNYSYDSLETRVKQIRSDDARYDSVQETLKRAENKKDAFTGMSPDQLIDVQEAIAGALPRVLPESSFSVAEEGALKALSDVNRELIAPAKPGAVPEGDIVSDFLPQLIRQLFRFAWLAVLVSLTVSGIMLVIAEDNEEKITSAKKMIIYSIIGFIFISFAFAIVKAVTDIDFFRFI